LEGEEVSAGALGGDSGALGGDEFVGLLGEVAENLPSDGRV
jgi:hypothetical protein